MTYRLLRLEAALHQRGGAREEEPAISQKIDALTPSPMQVSQRVKGQLQSGALGQQLPGRLLVRAAAMAPITDTKADDWGGCRDEAPRRGRDRAHPRIVVSILPAERTVCRTRMHGLLRG